MVYETYNGDDARTRLLKATALLLNARVDTEAPLLPSCDALWRKRDTGLYAVRVIDCRAASVEETAAWAADEARRCMLDASGWEERLKTEGDPELILILLLSDPCNPELVRSDFEAEIEKMHKPTRTRVWVTTEVFATTSHPDSPVDLFVIFDF
jgi:hypothetical protein